MRHLHSLPDPREYGFRWKAFEKARKQLDHVESKRREVRRREEELKARIQGEEQDDVRRLAGLILSGADDVAPGSDTPELRRLASEMKDLHRLSQALAAAEPQAESELVRVVQGNRGQWIPEVDHAVEEALEEERKALRKALEIAEPARAKRLRLQTLATWVRTAPPGFSPPSDVSVRSSFDRLGAEVDQAERMLRERLANENLAAGETA